MNAPDIFSYLDYRVFLKDLYLFRKKSHSKFSYHYYAQRIGMDRTSLYKVLNAERHISPELIQAFAQAFQLQLELPYFIQLVYYGRAETVVERSTYEAALKALRPISQIQIKDDQIEFFSQWYHIAIWLIVGQERISEANQLALKLNPEVSENQVQSSLELLMRLKLIRKNSKGIYSKSSENLTLSPQWDHNQVNAYLEQSLELAKYAIWNIDKSKRDISSLVMDVPLDKVQEFKDKIIQFRQDLIREINETQDCDSVYSFSMQFFPLTQESL